MCVSFQAWSINSFSYSDPLQTCENSGSFLSCSIALTVLLTSEGLDGNHCHLSLLCASTQSDGRQRLHGSQSFSLQQTGGNRREKGQGLSLPLWQWAVVSLLCVQASSFSRFLSGFYRDLFTSCFPALGMDASWISTDLILWPIQADQYLGDLTSPAAGCWIWHGDG